MNIRKISAAALAAVLAVTLCGCNNITENSESSDSGNNSGSSSTADAPVYPVPNDATFLRGAAGDVIGLSEITEARNAENQEIPPESMTEENFFKASTDSAYFCYPKYPCLTDRESEYDEVNLLFKDVPQDSQSSFVKVKKGDVVCGMKVSQASSDFNLNSPVPGVIVGTSLSLEGEITLTGYIRVVPGDEYGVAPGAVMFIPEGNVSLPVVRLDGCDKDGVITRRTGDVYIMNGSSAAESITYTNEFADYFLLGSTADTSADISCLTTDGSFTKVNVTIADISMKSSIDWLTQVSAELVSVTAAE